MASSSSSTGTSRAARVDRSPESYESLQRRNAAVEVLQSYEKLSWYSYARRESLQQTRMHFQNIVAGFTEADEAALVEWPTDNSTPPAREGDDDKGARRKSGATTGKGKERASGAAQTSPGGKGKEKSKDSALSTDSKSKKRRS